MYPLLFLDKEPDGARVVREAEKSSDDVGDPYEVVRCASCESEVARAADRFARHGRDEHVFTNPGGYTFHIGCWRDASGCVAIGDASSEWAWFDGWNWQIGVCRNCTTHLGWWFHQDDASFVALILNRIIL